jgi:hypothetical protein
MKPDRDTGSQKTVKVCKEAFTNYVASRGGRGVRQMSTLVYNPYRVKVATKGEGGQKFQKKWLHSL